MEEVLKFRQQEIEEYCQEFGKYLTQNAGILHLARCDVRLRCEHLIARIDEYQAELDRVKKHRKFEKAVREVIVKDISKSGPLRRLIKNMIQGG